MGEFIHSYMHGKVDEGDWPGPGTFVTYTGQNGYDRDREHANQYLVIGQTYVVENFKLGGWSSDVQFAEFPGQWFNSVMFSFLTPNERRSRDGARSLKEAMNGTLP